MSISPEQLEKAGVSCSVCGQALSVGANPASVAKLKDKTFNGKPVNIAVCRNPPYIHKHSKKDTTIKTVYQVADNRAGFITLMYKSLDKPPMKKCPSCGQEIKEVQKKPAVSKGK